MSSKPAQESNSISLYVIIGHPRATNARAKAMLRLREHVGRVTLVYPGDTNLESDHWAIKPWPNPSGILAAFGLHALKDKIDRRILFPSNRVLFYLALRKKLRKRIEADEQAGMDVVVLTLMPPHGVAPIVPYLRAHCPNTRLLVDWQDLWLFDATYSSRIAPSKMHRAEKLERSVVHAADLNITTNEFAERLFVDLFNTQSERVTNIPHHFDSDDAASVTGSEGESVRLGFLGTLMKPPKVPGERVLQAVDACVKKGYDVEFHLFGGAQWRARPFIESMETDAVHLHPHAPHKEAIAKLSTSDLLVLTLADEENCRVIMHGKLPHYLVLQIPIIALVPDNSFVAQVVRETGSGVVIDTSQDWGDALQHVLDEFAKGTRLGCTFDMDRISEYSWQNIEKKWLSAISK